MIAKNPADLNDDLSDLIGSPLRAEPMTPPANYQGGQPAGKLFERPCAACRGTGKFRSYTGRVVGNCFKCQGLGKITTKTDTVKTANAKASRLAANIEEFKAEYPDVWAWMDGSTFPVAVEMREKLFKYGSLFENSIDAARRMIARRDSAITERKENDAAREAQAAPVNIDALTAAFDKAAKTNKRVGLWIGNIKISPAKPGSKWAGSLYVRDKAADLYLGRVTAGSFVRSRDCSQERAAELIEIMADPKAAAIKHGKLTGACAVCRRTLSDPISVANGIGPICAENFGW